MTMADNDTNETVVDPNAGLWGGRSVASLTIIGIVLFGITIWTIIGNILVILSPMKNRRLRNISNYYIVSLAVADLFLGITVLPFSAIYELRRVWDLGVVFCNIWVSSDVMFCTASMLNLFAISVDRYMAISDPLSYHMKMTRTKALIFIAVVWVISLLISFVPLHVGWNTEDGSVQNYNNIYNQCDFIHNVTFSLVDGFLLFFIPLIVMTVIYVRVLLIAREQARKINALNVNIGHEARKSNKSAVDEHKATKVLAVIMGCFIICWVPYFCQFTFLPLSDNSLTWDEYSVLLWLGYVNSTLNPILYALLNSEYRTAFKRLICCCMEEKRPKWEYTSDSSDSPRKRHPTTVSGEISMGDKN